MTNFSNDLVSAYFKKLAETGNTVRSSEACCISVSTGRTLESKYPDSAEGAMFEYREMLRGILQDRLKDPALFSEKLLLKELEVMDSRYRNKVDVQHNVSVELVGRLQRAKARSLEIVEDKDEYRDDRGGILLAASADARAPLISDYMVDDDTKMSAGEIIEAEFSEV